MGFHELLPHHTMLDDFSQKPPHTFLHLWDVCKVRDGIPKKKRRLLLKQKNPVQSVTISYRLLQQDCLLVSTVRLESWCLLVYLQHDLLHVSFDESLSHRKCCQQHSQIDAHGLCLLSSFDVFRISFI